MEGKNKQTDQLFELLLKAAVIQNSLDELEKDHSVYDQEDIKISDDCDRKIRRMIKNHWLKAKFVKALKITQKAAVFLSIVLGLSFLLLLQFKDVRAACYNIFIGFTDKYMQFDYGSGKQKADIKVAYVPDGYYETVRESLETGCCLVYQNDNNDSININYFIDNSTNFLRRRFLKALHLQEKRHAPLRNWRRKQTQAAFSILCYQALL